MTDELWADRHYRPEVRPERASGKPVCDTRGCMRSPTHKVVWPDGMTLPYCRDHAMQVASLSETAEKVVPIE
jgi:hypothetical protein